MSLVVAGVLLVAHVSLVAHVARVWLVACVSLVRVLLVARVSLVARVACVWLVCRSFVLLVCRSLLVCRLCVAGPAGAQAVSNPSQLLVCLDKGVWVSPPCRGGTAGDAVGQEGRAQPKRAVA